MRAIFESGFYYIYLLFIIGLGIYLIIKNNNRLFGVALAILGFGDAWHLIPRAIGLYTKTLDAPGETLAMWLGIGKLVTSITMTIFYVLLYLFIYQRVAKRRNQNLDICVAVLFISRVALCAFPQNEWLTNGNSLLWDALRNIPFILLGALVIYLSFKHFKEIKFLKWLWLLIILSFGFYLPVVFLAAQYSWVGMLMLPKTMCYMVIGLFAYLEIKEQKETN